MSDMESDYNDYDVAKENEDGLHDGRTGPSRGLMIAVLIALAALVIGAMVLALLP
jgi:hypothetical protein